jgi:hypothetical protein
MHEFIRFTNQAIILRNGVEIWRGHNLLTTAGKKYLADQLSSSSDLDAMSHIAIGTNSTAATVGDTALAAEFTRVALDSGTPTQGSAPNEDKLTYSATLTKSDFQTAGGTLDSTTFTEMGLVNDGTSGGTLMNRVVFTGQVFTTATENMKFILIYTIT